MIGPSRTDVSVHPECFEGTAGSTQQGRMRIWSSRFLAAVFICMICFKAQGDIGTCTVTGVFPKEAILTIKIDPGYMIVNDPSNPAYRVRWWDGSSSQYQEEKFTASPIKISGLKPASSYLMGIRAYSKRTSGGLLKLERYRWACGSVRVTTKAVADNYCGQATWHDGGKVQAKWDGENCYVRKAPAGSSPFIWDAKYYISSTPSTDCPMGGHDGANCYVVKKPTSGFIWENGFYQKPGPDGSCPAGWPSDSVNCFFGKAPWGTRAFEWQGGFYTTPRPKCMDGRFDGANCFMGTPQPGRKPFIYEGSFYFD